MADYDFSDPVIDQDLDNLAEKYEHLGEISAGEGNETERSLSGQLILLTTVLITANILFLGDGAIISKITHAQKEYIFSALILEAIATIAGIINYLRIEHYYNEWATNFYETAEMVNDRKYKTPTGLNRKLSANQEKVKERKFRFALWAQILTIIGSLAIYLALLYNIFFVT
jgi:hypothetical protein